MLAQLAVWCTARHGDRCHTGVVLDVDLGGPQAIPLAVLAPGVSAARALSSPDEREPGAYNVRMMVIALNADAVGE